ncbi:hypothetical protein, partial [Paenibacillus sp. FSL R7-0337]|uniref:hypothetical protein n=1 Tax=Paenibacillus sp. FSL R7-0337 TaxID=1926588 RepID=UPI001C4D751E
MQSTIPQDGRIVLFCALGRILRGNPRHATATLNVIGFSITFGLHTSAMVIPLSSRQIKKAKQPARADTQSARA